MRSASIVVRLRINKSRPRHPTLLTTSDVEPEWKDNHRLCRLLRGDKIIQVTVHGMLGEFQRVSLQFARTEAGIRLGSLGLNFGK